MTTHAHFAGEFGAQKMTKKLEKDPVYRTARAEYFAKEAHQARFDHANATSPSEKATLALTIAHAASRAKSHAEAVKKLAPGDSDLIVKAVYASQQAQKIHEEINGGKKPKASTLTGGISVSNFHKLFDDSKVPEDESHGGLKVGDKFEHPYDIKPHTVESFTQFTGTTSKKDAVISKETGEVLKISEIKKINVSAAENVAAAQSVVKAAAAKPQAINPKFVELGAQKLNKKNKSDAAYRAARAEYFGKSAAEAAKKHATAQTEAEKAAHALEAMHALKRATSHVNAVKKLAPSDGALHLQAAKGRAMAHEAVKSIQQQKTIAAPPTKYELSMKAEMMSGKVTDAASHRVAMKAHIDAYNAHLEAGDLMSAQSHEKSVAYHAEQIQKTAAAESKVISDAKSLAPHEFTSYKKKYGSLLSYKEVEAAKAYSGNAFVSINNALRKDLHHGAYAESIQHLDTAIAKSSLPDHVIVYRGAGGQTTYAHYAQMSVGDHYVEKGYSSTSALKSSAFGGSVTMHITVPKGGKGAPIPSHHAHEKEILLPRNQKFRIDKIDKQSDAYTKIITLHVTAIQE
jgi:hypothetical protein